MELITYKQAMEAYKISRPTLFKWIKEGNITVYFPKTNEVFINGQMRPLMPNQINPKQGRKFAIIRKKDVDCYLNR